jgi:hypothetical protein
MVLYENDIIPKYGYKLYLCYPKCDEMTFGHFILECACIVCAPDEGETYTFKLYTNMYISQIKNITNTGQGR